MDRLAADPLVGRTIGQYEVIAKLGGGGMGIVYSARDLRLGRMVALKFLPPQWSHDDTSKQRFIREAQAASATDHRNICTVHDIGAADDGQLFIVMAHYDGETLKQRLERGPLGIDEAIDVAAQVAEGLAKAHAQGVVHRDIKPGNLMLTEDGVKILDFGLAKFADALQLTVAGSTLGTVAYMSPEQARAEEADARSDIWSLGVVLYEMVAAAVPFKGTYAEAIAHAIRTDPPPPIVRPDGDVPEALIAIIKYALQKDPAERYHGARELARDLRLLQGRTLPIELRTEYVSALSGADTRSRRRPFWRRPAAVATTAAIVGLLIGVPLWLVAPAPRLPVAIAPVVNQTGYSELDAYRLPLTMALVEQFSESPTLRVLSYERLLQIVRAFRDDEKDISSRDAIQAIATHSGARVVLVPTLLYENGGWRARVELRDAATATNVAVVDTMPVVSSLPKDAVYQLIPGAAAAVESRAAADGSGASFVAWARSFVTRGNTAARVSRPRTLDAAAALAQGRDAYEQQEYGAALQAFTRAAMLDGQDAMPAAWRSRVARIMRHDDEAAEAARQAEKLLTADEPAANERFVRAVAGEARRDLAAAEAAFRDLVKRDPDNPSWHIELAAFLERQLRAADAVAAYQQALTLDPLLPRPHLELCRLYGPLRLNDPPKARQEGERALAEYRKLGARAGEAQSLWCLADVLNLGGERERGESQQYAEAARQIFEGLRYPYNLSRAYNYLALSASAQGRYKDAAALWTTSLEQARQAGNVALEPAILSNLGVMYRNLGQLKQAVAFLGEGYRKYEALGDQQRAAHNQVNAASIVLEYAAGDMDRAVRDVQNALGVLERLGDRDFQVYSLQVLAAFFRNAGRLEDSTRELNKALSLAKASNLDDEIARITIDRARTLIAGASYADADMLLRSVLGKGNSTDTAAASTQLGLTAMRMGDLDAARQAVTAAIAEVQKSGDAELLPLLYTTEGELAYQRGDATAARASFTKAIASSSADLVDPAVVEARAFLAYLESLERASPAARSTIAVAIQDARRMRRPALEARCRIFFAQAALRSGELDAALRALDEAPQDTSAQTVGPELKAQIAYWRSEVLGAKGNEQEARAAQADARRLIDTVRAALPAGVQPLFVARRDIHPIVGSV